MIKHQVLSHFLFGVSLLTLANCSSAAKDDTTSQVQDGVQTSDFGTDTQPTTTLTTDTKSPAGQIGTDTNTIAGLGAPGTTSPFAGLGSDTEIPGVAPLSMPANYNYGNLISNISSIPFIDPSNTKYFPRPELLKMYYCSIETLLGYEASRKAALVEAYYLDVLGRLPDPNGFVFWIRQLSNEYAVTVREPVARGIVRSDENYENIVTGMYRSILERIRRPSEGTYWVNRLKSGASFEQVTSEFHASNENFQTKYRKNQRQWLKSLYRKILARTGKVAKGVNDINSWEITYWVNVRPLSNLANRTQTALDIFNSFEARQKFVETLYGKYLGRPGDAAGIKAWVDQMTAGLTRFDVEVKFLASDEYFTNSAIRRFLSLNAPSFCDQ